MSLPKAFIFDMDGLMLDSEPLYHQAWQAAAAELGYALDTELYLRLVGRSSAEADRAFIQTFGEAFPVAEFNQRWDAQWRNLINTKGIALQPGLLPLLDWIEQQNIPKVVGTSSNSTEAELCLSKTGIRDRFSTVVTVDQVRAGKPEPDIFQEAVKRLGVPASDCLVLEDSNAGVEAAHSAGIQVIMVPDMQVPTEKSKAIALHILSSLQDVLAWLRSL